MKVENVIPDGYQKLQLRELQEMLLSHMEVVHKACMANGIKYYIIGGTLLGAIRHGGFIPWDDDIDIAMMREDFEKFKNLFSSIMDERRYFLQNYDTDVDFWHPLMRVCIKDTFLKFDCESHLKYCKNCYIDIFPLDNVPEDEELRHKQELKLKKYNRLLTRKLYPIFESNSRFAVAVKQLMALALSVIPLKHLQKAVVSEMIKYDTVSTSCVCSMASHYSYRKQIMNREIYGNPTLVKFENLELFAPELKEKYLTHLFGKNYMQIPPVERRDKPCDVYVGESIVHDIKLK